MSDETNERGGGAVVNPQSGRWVVLDSLAGAPVKPFLQYQGDGAADRDFVQFCDHDRAKQACLTDESWSALLDLIRRASEPVQEEAERPPTTMTMAELVEAVDRGELMQVRITREGRTEWVDFGPVNGIQMRGVLMDVIVRRKPAATRTVRADELRPGMKLEGGGEISSATRFVAVACVGEGMRDGFEVAFAPSDEFTVLADPVLAPVPTGEGTGE